MRGGASGRSTACRRRSRTCSTSSPAGRRPSAASARSRTTSPTGTARSPSGSRRPAPSWSARPTAPVMGFRGTCDNPLFGPTRNPFDTRLERRRLVRRQRRGGRRRPPAARRGHRRAAARSASRRPGAASTATRPPTAACRSSSGPNAFAGDLPFVFEGPITRTVEDAALALTALAGYDPRDPLSLDETVDFTAATTRDHQGLEDRATAPTSTSSRSIRASPRSWPTRCAPSRRPAPMSSR